MRGRFLLGPSWKTYPIKLHKGWISFVFPVQGLILELSTARAERDVSNQVS